MGKGYLISPRPRPPPPAIEPDVERVSRALCILEGRQPDADWRYQGDVFLTVETDYPQWWRRREYLERARAHLAAREQDPTAALSYNPPA